MTDAAAEIALRPVRPEDHELLFRIYASTRAGELAIVPWSDEQKAAFLRQQFEAQSTDWGEHYKDADLSVIEIEGRPGGRFYVQRRAEEIRLIDIALLPEFRNRGIGTMLLKRLFGEGSERNVPVTLHVETFNPARALYERLGFTARAEHGMYVLMAWKPRAAEVAVS